ncbi:MAG: hypothetical protein IJQ39_00465, partial [Thermoguttaceae bacterium]|nr:hypothetical protein [Thermoguttaceae bacterium]
RSLRYRLPINRQNQIFCGSLFRWQAGTPAVDEDVDPPKDVTLLTKKAGNIPAFHFTFASFTPGWLYAPRLA